MLFLLAPVFGLALALLLNQKVPGIRVVKSIAVLSNEHLVTFGIVAAALWSQIAFCLVLFLAGLSQIDSNLIDAGWVACP